MRKSVIGLMRKRLSVLLGVLLAVSVASPNWLVTQVGKATITGSVTDSSGAMLAGTAIEAKNIDTNVTQSTITGSQGHYIIPDLPIGNYDIQASKVGFKTIVHKGITLRVGSEPVVDFSLSVGSVSQSIAVEGQVSQVDTQNSAVSSLVTPTQMSELPLNGRNFEQLISLAPGVSTIPQVPAGSVGSTWYGNENNYSVSGSRPVGEAFLLDNTDISDFFNHGTGSAVAGTSLGVEGIAEFQLLTNTYSAQFGGTGAVMNMVTKSGTNDFHGSAYDYLRNSAVDSRGYFDGPSVPPYRRNQFGGSIGGPVKKDKLFFFSNYEGLRSLLGVTSVAQVPEPYVATGKVCSVNPQTVSPGATTCPAEDLVNVGFAPGAIGTLLGQMLALYPAPDPGSLDFGGVGNYKAVANLITQENYFLERVDYTFSPKDSLFGRYVADWVTQTNPFAGSAIPKWGDSEHTANQYFTLEEKRIFSPTTINLLRFSFVRTHSNATTTGETPPLDLLPGSGRQDGDISPGDGVSAIGAAGLDPFVVIQNKFTVGDDLFWNRGAHSFKIGVSLPRVQTNLSAPFLLGGDYVFGSLANFLQGEPSIFLGTQAPSPTFNSWRYFRQVELFPYVQDDWKISSKLTLNLGLRWDFATNAVGAGGVPLNAIPHPLTDTGFTVTQHVLANNPNWWNLDPRVGAAFDPFANHKTSIRAGFGIFHEQVEARTFAPNYYLSPPSGAVLIIPTPGSYNSFPNPFAGFTLPFSQFLGLDFATDTAPYVIQYNLTVQHELAGGVVLSIGYVGSSGVHLFSIYNQNLPETTTGSPVGAGTVANPFTGVPTNPTWGSLNDSAPVSHSSYNSLQVSASRQFSQSWQAQGSYTYASCLDDGSVTSSPESGATAVGGEGGWPITNPYNHAYDRGPCDFNRRQILSVNGLYFLPFRQNRLVAGWQATTILSASTGLPLNIEDGFNQALTNGIEGPRPNYSGAPGCHPSQTLGKVDEWFNPQCYALEPIGTEGNVSRDSLVGPGILDLDSSVIKQTKITEKLNCEFRAEFFNMINHTNLGAPSTFAFTGAAGPPSAAAYNPLAGQITTLATTPRQIQFALKLTF